MKMLRKRFDCESFENSQENVSDGIYFSKATSLQCTDTINRLHKLLFSENVPKYYMSQEIILEKLMV